MQNYDAIEFENYEYYEEEGERSVGDGSLSFNVMVVDTNTQEAHSLFVVYHIDHFGYESDIAENIHMTDDGKTAKRVEDFSYDNFYEQDFDSSFIKNHKALVNDIFDYYTNENYYTIESIMNDDYSKNMDEIEFEL